MIHLNPNSATAQTIYLTLQEMKKDFDAFANYLLEFQSMASRKSHFFIGNIEEGTLDVTGAVGYNIPTIDVPDNVIYYQ